MSARTVLALGSSGAQLLHGWNSGKPERPTTTQSRWLAAISWEKSGTETIVAPLDTSRVFSIYVYTMKQEGKLVKISMNFPPTLWKALQFRALEENTTATAIMVRLVSEYLGKSKSKVRAKAK
jgi:hypothetical protein